MEKLTVFSVFLFLMIIPLTAQEESKHEFSVNRESGFNKNDYYSTITESNNRKLVTADIYRNPGIKVVSFSAPNDKIISKNGRIVGFNQLGDTQFVSNYHRNRLNGEWRSWYDNRISCDSGRLVNNVPDGEWKGWYPNGNIRFVYHFNARKLAALKDELRRQPKTRFYIIAGKAPVDAAKYYNARRIFGHKISPEKGIFLSQQINHDPYTAVVLKSLVDENTRAEMDKLYVPPFSEGLLHGNYDEYYPDGNLKKTGVYINGLKEGMWEEYSQKGVKAVGTYRHGYPSGEWRYYDKSGKLLSWKRFDSKGNEIETFDFSKRSPYNRS